MVLLVGDGCKSVCARLSDVKVINISRQSSVGYNFCPRKNCLHKAQVHIHAPLCWFEDLIIFVLLMMQLC